MDDLVSHGHTSPLSQQTGGTIVAVSNKEKLGVLGAVAAGDPATKRMERHPTYLDAVPRPPGLDSLAWRSGELGE